MDREERNWNLIEANTDGFVYANMSGLQTFDAEDIISFYAANYLPEEQTEDEQNRIMQTFINAIRRVGLVDLPYAAILAGRLPWPADSPRESPTRQFPESPAALDVYSPVDNDPLPSPIDSDSDGSWPEEEDADELHMDPPYFQFRLVTSNEPARPRSTSEPFYEPDVDCAAMLNHLRDNILDLRRLKDGFSQMIPVMKERVNIVRRFSFCTQAKTSELVRLLTDAELTISEISLPNENGLSHTRWGVLCRAVHNAEDMLVSLKGDFSRVDQHLIEFERTLVGEEKKTRLALFRYERARYRKPFQDVVDSLRLSHLREQFAFPRLSPDPRPLDAAALAAIAAEDGDCVICREDLGEGEAAVISYDCMKPYHTDCLLSWFNETLAHTCNDMTCPSCREVCYTDDYGELVEHRNRQLRCL
ncbi:hypothetical protein PV08_04789 [Exophiala spinifera]|uniref:RING-type domain-containing protein n=1 Tax=Exophiala spinifera TaxID=91928 RepID=A0A0D2C1R5_9EURO|nr:uncharacterized protein PV08_04789 [Exophiala spinifera]KIW17594.1 hypothetical protein PV08_04789 [Exophiala spinifera]